MAQLNRRGPFGLAARLALLALLASALGTSQSQGGDRGSSSGGEHLVAVAESRLSETFNGLPMSFAPNVGQAGAAGSDFGSTGTGFTVGLSADRAVYSLRPSATLPAAAMSMRLVGGNQAAPAVGNGLLPGHVNYLMGSNPAGWRTGVPTYGSVVFDGVYPGVDAVYRGDAGQLE